MRVGRGTPSYDELLARMRDLPDGHRGQIYDGELHIIEPPSARRAHTLAEITAMLMAGSALGDPVPAGWSFLPHAELAVGAEGLLVADVAGWRLGPDALAAAAAPLRLAPAWVCEVASDSMRTFVLTAKRRAYAELGVEHLWVAHPDAHVLEVFEGRRGRWSLLQAISDEGPVKVPPFESMRFDAGDLWLPHPPPSNLRNGPSSRRN